MEKLSIREASERFGLSRARLYQLLEKGAIVGDTGKKHSDGTPVRQIKWYASVIEVLKRHLEADFALTGGAA
ncbi:MAG: hypothetical protein ABFS56_09995 [Pseudomonadota bacterium]